MAIKTVITTRTRSFDAAPATRCHRSPLRGAGPRGATVCISCL